MSQYPIVLTKRFLKDTDYISYNQPIPSHFLIHISLQSDNVNLLNLKLLFLIQHNSYLDLRHWNAKILG